MHIARGLYYSSYRSPRILVWTIGVIILVLMMGTAFLGYKRSPKWSKSNSLKFNDSLRNPIKISNYHNLIFYNVKPNFYKIPFKCKCNHLCISTNASLSNSKILNTNNKDQDKGQITKKLNDFLIEKNLQPLYCYEDLNLDSTRKIIQTQTKNLSGIYLILNKVTLDYYIGSAATNRFYARFSNHLINFHGSKIVKLAVRKYKLSQFAFLILELFPEIVNKENNKKLLDLEDFYLKSLLPNYNILTEAGSSFGYKHTDISRLKMKSNYSPERREQIGNLNRGKNLHALASVETIEKIRKKALPIGIERKRPNFTKQSILNMKKNSKSIIIYNLDNTVYGEYSSIVEGAKSLGCNEKTIRRALKTEKKLLKRHWIVKFK